MASKARAEGGCRARTDGTASWMLCVDMTKPSERGGRFTSSRLNLWLQGCNSVTSPVRATYRNMAARNGHGARIACYLCRS